MKNGTRKLAAQKKRIALLIQYDGSEFNGWQIQKGGRTVQGEIEKALKIFSKQDIRITASGRTDTGVHALGQVAHFDLEKKIDGNKDLQKLCVSLNGILDNDVSVLNSFFVPDDFHARFNAHRREYIYLIYNNTQRSPFMRQRAMWVREKLDTEYFKKASGHLTGEHDFISFCKKISSDVNTVRIIDEIEVKRKGDIISIRIRGTAFLHNMVRIITGTLVEMFLEKKKPEYILEILEQRNRDMAGTTAPSCGLYLKKVIYKPSLENMVAAFNNDQ